MKNILVIFIALFSLSGCVAKRYLTESQSRVAQLRSDSSQFENKISIQQKNLSEQQGNIAVLNKKITEQEDNIANLRIKISELSSQSAKQQDLLSKRQSELSESESNLKDQQQKLQQLQNLLAQQKAASDQLKNKMSEALKGFNSNELTVVQKDGKVYVSLSENLLFPSGSAVVNTKGVDALSKLAAVLNVNGDVAVDIEGHTDSIPIRGKYADNWDLSTARANSIVRILVNNYKVDPKRVISSGHSYYDPIASNATPEGRALNRRTDIILSPKLEEMYKLLGQ